MMAISRSSLAGLLRSERGRSSKDRTNRLLLAEHRVDPGDPEVTGQVARLEFEALRLLQRRPGCDAATEALAMTLPDSPAHLKAKALARDSTCPGVDSTPPPP